MPLTPVHHWLHQWAVASQQQSRRNAMVAATIVAHIGSRNSPSPCRMPIAKVRMTLLQTSIASSWRERSVMPLPARRTPRW